jgi:hypothetical protein
MASAPAETRSAPRRAVCATCGADFAPGQEYCLDCGARRLRTAVEPAPPWRRTGPWYAASGWAWPAAAALVVAVLAAAVAVAIRLADEGDADAVLIATLPQAVAPSEDPLAPEEPVAPPPPAAATTTAPARPPAPARRDGLVTWPAGRDGWTVVLASLPSQAGRGVAVDRAKAASQSGVPNVGILETNEFSSFHSGYLVVFSGVHRTEEAAQRAAEAAHDEGYRDAYAREVAR